MVAVADLHGDDGGFARGEEAPELGAELAVPARAVRAGPAEGAEDALPAGDEVEHLARDGADDDDFPPLTDGKRPLKVAAFTLA